jgi:hypothetical protein
MVVSSTISKKWSETSNRFPRPWHRAQGFGVNVPLPENSLGGHKVKNPRMNQGRSVSGFDKTGFVGILF